MIVLLIMVCAIGIAAFGPCPRRLRIVILASMIAACLAGIVYVLTASASARVVSGFFTLIGLVGAGWIAIGMILAARPRT